MPEPHLNLGDAPAFVDQPAAMPVPEIMEADVRHAGALRGLVEHPAQVAVVQALAGAGREHRAGRVRSGRPQIAGQFGVEVDRPCARLGLRVRLEHASVVLAADAQRGLVAVAREVVPLKAEGLADAAASAGERLEQQGANDRGRPR